MRKFKELLDKKLYYIYKKLKLKMESSQKKPIYKLITLGEPSVGKSCFLR